MKKSTLKTKPINSKNDPKGNKPVNHPATEFPLAEKDEEKQAEDELREQVKIDKTD